MSCKDILQGEWVNLHTVLDFIEENLMTNNPRFVLDDWDCKYINIRVDMRTGKAYLTPGNTKED